MLFKKWQNSRFFYFFKNYRNFETNIPRKGISGSQSQFPHSCVCERSVSLFYWRKDVDQSWDYINRSQTHECWNWDWGRAIPRKGIHIGDFRCSVEQLSNKIVMTHWFSYANTVLWCTSYYYFFIPINTVHVRIFEVIQGCNITN
jgi:hypothetical protein